MIREVAGYELRRTARSQCAAVVISEGTSRLQAAFAAVAKPVSRVRVAS